VFAWLPNIVLRGCQILEKLLYEKNEFWDQIVESWISETSHTNLHCFKSGLLQGQRPGE